MASSLAAKRWARCSRCLRSASRISCITACAYDAIRFVDTPRGRKAQVNAVLCKGDGLCAAKCPTSAVALNHFTDDAILSQIDAAIPV